MSLPGAPVVRRPWWRRQRGRLLGGASILGGVLLWELVACAAVKNPLFLAPPTAVGGALLRLARSGDLVRHAWASLQEFALCFALAVVLGVALGTATAGSPTLRALLGPWVAGLQSTPLIALGPLFVLWLGLGPASKVAVILLVAVFPILINTHAGVAAAPRPLVEMARAFGAGRVQTYRAVVLPAALPFLVAGLRLGVARGLVGVVVAELFAAQRGLGYLINVSAQTFNTASLLAAVVVLAAAGVAANQALLGVEARLAPWRGVQRDG